ncbi:MAG TPA: BamA/TamA family outer membrane protein [Anaeromyxobacteraceae bacterium]|nr:BamA/TamA family outer membrane protein [Anaeromyxobacteraceae bacterium]
MRSRPTAIPAIATAIALAMPAAAQLPAAQLSAAPAAVPARPASAPEDASGAPAPRLYQIEKIEIRGLSHAHESAVRSRLLLTEGDLLDEEKVLLSRLRLLQLGWFSRVETRVERGSARGLVVLVFEVDERNTLLVSDLILGSTPAQPIYGGFGLSQQNFLGRGLGMSGAFVYGGPPSGRPGDPDRFALRATFFAPDLELPHLPRLVAGASALWLRGEEFTCTTPDCSEADHHYGSAPRLRYERIGGEATIGFRPGPFERIMGGYRLEHLHGAFLAGTTAPGKLPDLRAGDSLLAALTGTWELDTRDDFFFPREGLRTVAQITFASHILGGNYEYSRYYLQLETAYALFGKPLRLQLAVGAAQGDAPFFDRFYAADFMYFAIGPALGRALELNFSTDSRYDAFLGMAGIEYAVPLWRGSGFFRRGYLAIGARAVYSSAEPGAGRTTVSKWPFSAECALRLDTPVGFFNASLGYLVDIVL